ncbi:hypothetical protein HPB47_019967, partial [Ixodes persulcatus]
MKPWNCYNTCRPNGNNYGQLQPVCGGHKHDSSADEETAAVQMPAYQLLLAERQDENEPTCEAYSFEVWPFRGDVRAQALVSEIVSSRSEDATPLRLAKPRQPLPHSKTESAESFRRRQTRHQAITTVAHAPAFGYGYGVGHLGYGLGHFGYGHGLSSYGLNYGYGLGTYGDYATLLRKKKSVTNVATAYHAAPAITTVAHAPSFGYGYGVGHLGYGLGHFGYGHGLSSYGLNYGYGLGTYGDYATLLRKKK